MRCAVTYEVCVFYNGQWKVDSLYDDRDIALFEAQRVLEGSHCTGVRVAEERLDDRTAKYVTRTIFRKTKVDDSNRDNMEREKKLRRDAEARNGAANVRRIESYEGAAGVAAVASPVDFGLIFRLLLGAIIILGGIAAILALRSLH